MGSDRQSVSRQASVDRVACLVGEASLYFACAVSYQMFSRIRLSRRFHLVYARLEVNGHLLGFSGRQRGGKGAFQAGPGDLEPAILRFVSEAG